MQCLTAGSPLPDCIPNSAAGAAGSADLAIGSQKVFFGGEKSFSGRSPRTAASDADSPPNTVFFEKKP